MKNEDFRHLLDDYTDERVALSNRRHWVYIVLALVGGIGGLHNFYAYRFWSAEKQAGTFMGSLIAALVFLGLAAKAGFAVSGLVFIPCLLGFFFLFAWVVSDILLVRKDGYGRMLL